ncbi:MAG TPA: hypothetical protein VHC67_01590 [Gaiellaceae bacterium]|nr:hypothetical protein [Gaiellaceae bacterium]
MTALAIDWGAFPLLMGVLAAGCGSLLQSIARGRLRAVLPTGFAVIVAVEELASLSPVSARLAPAAVAALAAGGLATRLRTRIAPDAARAAAALTTFAAYAAPVVLSGAATFAGYIKLDDTSTFLGLADYVSAHGRGVSGAATSTYALAVHVNLGQGYPTASFVPIELGRTFLRQDIAWLYQPYLAFAAAMLALALYELQRGVIDRRWLRAVVAVAAAQPALLFGFALWGGVKELVAAALVATLAVAGRGVLERDPGAASALAVAVAAAAIVSALSLGGAIWVAPLGLALVPLLARGRRRSLMLALACSVALAAPTLADARRFLRPANVTSFTTTDLLGNLDHPLHAVQAFGIWPAADFRLQPTSAGATAILIAVAAGLAALGLIFATRRRKRGLVLYAGTAVAVTGFTWVAASPWIAAKTYATAAPAFLLVAGIGAASLLEARRGLLRVCGAAGLAALVAGVGWSNALAYRGVALAPHDRLAELGRIGREFAGRGPALLTEYEPYAGRHFLRGLAEDSASDLRYLPDYLTSGGYLPKGAGADVDRFTLATLLDYRLLITRRSPAESRPPSVFRLAFRGRSYDVWQRPDRPSRIVQHLALGAGDDPAGIAACADVHALAAAAGRGGRIVASTRGGAAVLPLSNIALPPGWGTDSADLAAWPAGGGTLASSFSTRRGGTFDLSVGGSFAEQLTVLVDGRVVAKRAPQLGWTGALTPLGRVTVGPGRHVVTLRLRRSWWRPGQAAAPLAPLGPVVVGTSDPGPLLSVPVADASRLCGKSFDWLEAIAR